MDKLFGKKKTVEQQMRFFDFLYLFLLRYFQRENERQMRRQTRGIERDRAGLEKEEKKIEAEIKKAAKMGNKEACKILAKQLVQLRKQKTRTYQASAQISSIGTKQKIMHANQKMAQSMGKTAATMAKMNKQMNPQKMAKTLAQFERENMKMEGMEEMMDDAMGNLF